jgi:hypothetical protein
VTADDYARQVAFALRDLPRRQRRELIAELRAHLAELPPGTYLVGRLGQPERYAAELREAAGLEVRRGLAALVHSSRVRKLALWVAALSVVALGIGTLVWLTSYQPLAFGGRSVYPAGSKPMAGAAQYNVPFRQGARFRAGISIVNNGRYTVRVLGITGVPSFGYLPLTHRRLMVSGPVPKNHAQWVKPNRTFRPIDLPPGRVMFLQLNGTYHARCHPDKNSQEGKDSPGSSCATASFGHLRPYESTFPTRCLSTLRRTRSAWVTAARP